MRKQSKRQMVKGNVRTASPPKRGTIELVEIINNNARREQLSIRTHYITTTVGHL